MEYVCYACGCKDIKVEIDCVAYDKITYQSIGTYSRKECQNCNLLWIDDNWFYQHRKDWQEWYANIQKYGRCYV